MSNHRFSIKFVVGATLIITAAVFISDQISYKHFIVPYLQNIQYVPQLWWVMIFCPILLCVILVGAKADNIPEILVASIATSVACRFYLYLSAIIDQPGRLKSNALEAPFIFWTAGFLFNFLIVTICLMIGWSIAKLFKRIRGGMINRK